MLRTNTCFRIASFLHSRYGWSFHSVLKQNAVLASAVTAYAFVLICLAMSVFEADVKRILFDCVFGLVLVICRLFALGTFFPTFAPIYSVRISLKKFSVISVQQQSFHRRRASALVWLR